MPRITLGLSPNLLRELDRLAGREKSTRAATLRRILERRLADAKVEEVLAKYKRGKMTFLEAAKKAGRSKRAMVALLRSRKLPIIYDEEEDLMGILGRR